VRVIAGINILLWGAFIWMGHGLLHNLALRSVPGYPNQGQMAYYLYFPIGMLTLALCAFGLSRIQKLRFVCLGIEVLALIAFVPFFLGYTGGV
jgi:hypothetical protein